VARRTAGAPPVAGGNGAATHDPTLGLTGAARLIDVEGAEREGYRRKAKRETWQEEAWSFFDIIGEVKQPTYFLANTCSLVRLFIGYQPDPEQDPTMAPDGMAGVFEANDILDRMDQGSRGGLAGLMRESVINHKVAGECWLVGLAERAETAPDPATGSDGESYRPETWDVRSVSEVFTKGSGKNMKYWTRDDPADNKGHELPEKTVLARVWQEHPEFSELPDCALRALLGLCEELLILTRVVKATGRSRIAGAGVLFLSNEFEIVTPPRQNTQPAGEESKTPSFTERLMEAMTLPIKDEGDPAGVVPLVVRGPTDAIDKGVKHLLFDRPLDTAMLEQRKEIIQRLAQGTDVPMEIVIGLKNINHWTSYQVDQSVWSRYGHPAVRVVVDAWTQGVLRPLLVSSYGVSPQVAERLMVWFDPAEAVTQPDRSANVIAAFDRFGISWEALRTYLQLSDADAPDDAEIARRIEIVVASKGGPPAGGDASNPAGGDAPNDGTPPSSPNATIAALEEALPGVVEYLRANDGHLPVITPYRPTPRAAASGHSVTRRRGEPLGRVLMAIDRRTRSGLQELADAAMMRALDQAGARLRSNAKRIPALRSRVQNEAAWKVPSLLGPTTARSLGFETDDELLAGTFDAMEPRFHQKVAAAQQQTLDLLAAAYDLDEDEVRSLQVQQQRDRNEAWVWLAGAMLALGHDRLYQPQPDAPQRGEFDASATVPPDLLREAMARAGGASGGAAGRDEPTGGVAIGDLVREVWARHGQVVSGWEWVYGDASSRTTPFEPHAALDGQEFTNWSDPILANDEGWPDVAFFKPGDHLWCQCDFIPAGPGPLGGGDDEADAEAQTEDVPIGVE
jgi:hypothetical protein